MPDIAIIYDTVGPDFTVAASMGPAKFSQPFDGDPGEYVLEDEFVQIGDYFANIPLGTPHDSYPKYYLVKEGPTQAVGVAGLVRWTRTYASKPVTRNDYTSYAYNFIGYFGQTPVAIGTTPTDGTVMGRDRFTETVNCRVQNDFFLIGTMQGADFASAASIPQIQRQRYYVPVGYWQAVGPTFVFVPLYTDPTQAALHGIATDLIYDITGPFAHIFPVASVPTRTAYEALITAGTEIVAEDSTLARWMGNIYVRTTKYIIAQ